MLKSSKKTTIFLFLTLYCFNLQSQVSINMDGSNPDTTAMLDIKSTTKGMLVPRMTTAQRNTISNPAIGLLVYDITINGFWFYRDIGWADLNAVNDADADPNNEMELPIGGTHGQVLQTDGAGTVNWVNQTADTLVSNEAHISGTIIAGSINPTPLSSPINGNENLIMPGITSDYTISVEDGNGRIQHKWNATYGPGETFVTAGEDAAFIDLNVAAVSDNDAWIEFKHADGNSATAGETISWNTQMIITQGGGVGINEISPDDRLHISDGGYGTRVRAENTGNGWAGLLSKNTLGEMFIGLQGAFDANPGEFHIFDNVGGARRLVIDAAGEVGIGKNNPSVKLDVNGSVNCTGGTCSSDFRWKKNIQPLNNTLSNIQKLSGVSYYWRTTEFPDKDFSDDKQIGLIAQDVEKIYPELVKTDNEGYKSMDYMSLTAVLLEATKEQQKEIELLKKGSLQLKVDNEDMKNRLEKLEALIH